LIIGCKKAMDDVCIGCSRCPVGFNRRAGTFTRYKDEPACNGWQDEVDEATAQTRGRRDYKGNGSPRTEAKSLRDE
jgi:hypothetical protein